MTDDEIELEAYAQIFSGAESILEDWINESGDFTDEDFDKIYAKAFELLKELRGRYLYATEEKDTCGDLSRSE